MTKPIDFHFGCWTVGDDKMDNRFIDSQCLRLAASYYFIDRRLLISLKAHRSSGMGLSWMTAIGFLSFQQASPGAEQ